MFTEIFLKRWTHKEPVIIYEEVGVDGGGDVRRGSQRYFRLARGEGAKLFYKEVWGVWSLGIF